MISVRISKAAAADLAAILDYGVDRFGEEAAELYVAGFSESLELISEHPLIGAIHDTVRPPLRSLPHGRHRIYYEVLKDEVIVQRVLHMAMDVGLHL